MYNFSVDGKIIGFSQRPYVIAEISANHNGEIDLAKKLILAAKKAGADAVKFQTFTADSLSIDTDKKEFIISAGPWKNKRLYDLYKAAHTPWNWFPDLFEYARNIGITPISSPFDMKAVKLLEKLKTPFYKIASNELTDWPLLEAVIATGKPILLSTGTATKEELKLTVNLIKKSKNKIVVLHCVNSYPTIIGDSNLLTMPEIGSNFDVLFGLSDHSLSNTAAITAVALGACVVEKHLTLSRSDGGLDASFSLEPAEFKNLCDEVYDAWCSLGKVIYGGSTDLKKKGIFTRQLWSIRTILKGEKLSWENVKSIRAPIDAEGMSPMRFKEVIGKVAKKEIKIFEPIQSNLLIKSED